VLACFSSIGRMAAFSGERSWLGCCIRGESLIDGNLAPIAGSKAAAGPTQGPWASQPPSDLSKLFPRRPGASALRSRGVRVRPTARFSPQVENSDGGIAGVGKIGIAAFEAHVVVETPEVPSPLQGHRRV